MQHIIFLISTALSWIKIDPLQAICKPIFKKVNLLEKKASNSRTLTKLFQMDMFQIPQRSKQQDVQKKGERENKQG